MGYDISEVTGGVENGSDGWEFTLDLSDPSATTISGDFDASWFLGGISDGSITYSASALSTTDYGTLAFNAADGTFTFTVDRAAVIASGNDQVITFTVTGAVGIATDTDTVVLNILICLNRGTLLDTVDGPKPVEALRVGDRLPTLDNPPQAVRWIGSRKISKEELDADPSLRPVVIRRDALGLDLPRRDLLVSPQHRIHLSGWRAQILFGEDEVLVPAKSLVNGDTIRVAEDLDDAEYFHLLFDGHEIIYSEGLPTESFHPGAHSLDAMDGSVRAELLALFPHLDREDGYGAAARPSLKTWEGVMLGAVRRAYAS